jgi:hypothetical protein
MKRPEWRLRALRIGDIVFDHPATIPAPAINYNRRDATRQLIAQFGKSTSFHFVTVESRWVAGLLKQEAKAVSFFLFDTNGSCEVEQDVELFFYHLAYVADSPVSEAHKPTRLITMNPSALVAPNPEKPLTWRAIEMPGIDNQHNVGYMKQRKKPDESL